MDDGTTQQQRPGWRRALPDALHLGVLLAFSLVMVALIAQRGSLDTLPPLGDDASHVTRALQMRAAYWQPQGLAARLITLLFTWDSYPGLLYALTTATFNSVPSEADLVEALNLFFFIHTVLGWILARSLFGRPAAWAYVAMTALSPLLLASGHRYNVDMPLAHMVGLGLLALLATRGFSRLGMSVLFGVIAGLGLMTKWAWFFFLGPAAAAVAVVALFRSFGGMGKRVIAALVASAVALGVAWGMWTWGPSLGASFVRPGAATSPHTPVHTLLLVCAGGLVLAAVATLAATRLREQTWRPTAHLAVAGAWLLAIAGPWYTLLQGILRDRFRHESGVHAGRASTADILDLNLGTVEAFFPFIILWLALGLVLALWRLRTSLPHYLLAIMGSAFALALITWAIPQNPRYLFALGPMLAIAVASGLPTLGRLGWLPAGAIIALGGIATFAAPLNAATGWPPFVDDPALRSATSGTLIGARLADQTIPVLPAPPADDFGAITLLAHDLDDACPPGRCQVAVFAKDDYFIQGRTFEGLMALNGMERAAFQLIAPKVGEPGLPGFMRPEPRLAIFQPCALNPHPGESLEDRVAQYQARIAELGAGPVVELGTYPLPRGCTVSLVKLMWGQEIR